MADELIYDQILLNFSSRVDAKGLKSAVNSLEKLKDINGFSGLRQAGEDLKNFVSALETISTERMRALTDLAKAMKSLGGASKAMKAVATTAETVNPLNDTSIGGGVAPELESANRQAEELNTAMKKVKEETKETGKATADIAKEAKKALSPLGKLVARFKSFLQYRAMRAVWSAISNGIKEGLTNLEQWDKAKGFTGFIENMRLARESVLVLKNSLAVIVAPGLEALIGVLQKVATWAMTASNAISQFFAILGGKSTYRAVIWANTLADAEKKAGGSAKKATAEFKKQLMAFDEINNLTAPSESGSGGGGGGSSKASYSDMFELRSVDKAEMGYFSKWLDVIAGKLRDIKAHAIEFWEALKKVFQNTDYKVLIDGFGEMVTAILTVIDDTIKWGKKLVETKGFAEAVQKAVNLIGTAFKQVAVLVYEAKAAVAIFAYTIEWLGGIVQAYVHFWKSVWTDKDAFANFRKECEDAGKTLQAKVTREVIELNERLDYINGKKFRINIELNEVQKVQRYITETTSNIGLNRGQEYQVKASGGFVDTGQMFIAREAGAELVGNIGGHTAVMNNDQIVASVSQGVAQAVSSVLGSQGTNVNVSLEGDAKGLFKVVQKESRAYSARTGQPAMA